MTDLITTDLDPVPSRSAPSAFSSRMDTLLGKLPAWTTEANTLATGANTNATTATTQAGIATAQASDASDSADLAEDWATTVDAQVAATDYSAKEWAQGTTAQSSKRWATDTGSTVDGSDYSAKEWAQGDTAESAKYHAEAAADSAQTAINAPGTSATSVTSLAIGTGSKTLTIQTDKDLVEGMFVLIANTGTPTNYMAGQITSYTSGTGELIVNVTATGGSGTIAAWTVSLSAITFDAATESEMETGTETELRSMSPADILTAILAAPVNKMSILEKSANYTALLADKTKLVECTGTFTLSFDPAATLGEGWFCYVKSLTGDITLDPNGAETIDGVSTGTVEAGDIFIVSSDGTNLQCSKIYNRKPHYITATNATWTVPAGITELFVQGCGAGGGGGHAYTAERVGAGGGGGGYFEKIIAVSAGDTKNITIGSGGDGGTGSPQVAATAGGTTSFDTDCSATGGAAGESNHQNPYKAAPGSGSSGDINFSGGYGYSIRAPYTETSNYYMSSKGGDSYFGPAPLNHQTAGTVAGIDATTYGCGGSGALGEGGASVLNGGGGADGVVIIWY